MKRVSVVCLGLAALLVSAPGATAAPGDVVVPPDWQRKPDADAIGSVYPTAARQAGVIGKAKVGCNVSVSGRLEQCQALSETPPGWGFGAAAVAMTRYFSWRPQRVNGVPVGGAPVVIPVDFGASSGEYGAVVVTASDPDGAARAAATHLLNAPIWASQATPAQVAAAFPRDRLATTDEEHVTLRCKVLADGGMGHCSTTEDDPSFYAAAQSLAKYYRLDLAASEKPMPDQTYVDLSIMFKASSVAR